MTDNISTDGQTGVGQQNAPQTGPQNKGQASDSIQTTSRQMMPPTNQQQQQRQEPHQQSGLNANMSQSGVPDKQQQDNQMSMSDKNMVQVQQQQQQQQMHSLNQQPNLAIGQIGINFPPTAISQQQQQQHHLTQQQQQHPPPPMQLQHPPIKPLLVDEPKSDIAVEITPNQQSKQDSPQKTTITKVRLSDELNIFDWFRATDIIHQIAEKAKSSVDSVITTLDPGMREYLYSGGNVNIVVISDSQRLVSPIRDSFQDVFGRATVGAARFNPPSMIIDYPIRTACGFDAAAQVAREKVKKLRSDTSSIPQNQVVVVVQSALVDIRQEHNTADKSIPDVQPEWFLTYCMLIDDPVLKVCMKSFSHLVPVDQDVIESARASRYPESFQQRHLGFTASIDELMASKLRMSLEEMTGDENGCLWLPKWAGLYETQVIRQLSLTLAHSYRRKWDECASIETVVS